MFLFKYFLLFLMFSFMGWLIEEIYVYIDQKVLVNRGFLFGPYLPIYGVGSLLIILLLNKYYSEPYIVFLESIIISLIIEYVSSYVLETIFNDKWWDYEDRKYNINGRVCLETLLPFGLFGVISLYLINPFFIYLINLLNKNMIIIVSVLLFVLYIVDSISSIYIKFKIKNIKYDYKNNIKVKRLIRKINGNDIKKYERTTAK